MIILNKFLIRLPSLFKLPLPGNSCLNWAEKFGLSYQGENEFLN